MNYMDQIQKSLDELTNVYKGKSGEDRDKDTNREHGKEGKAVEEGNEGKYAKGNKKDEDKEDIDSHKHVEKSMHLGYSPSNPIMSVLASHQMTPEMLATIAHRQGFNSINDFLSYFEPKQEYGSQYAGEGNGETATDTELYIETSGNSLHNPGQYINPLGMNSGGSPNNL